MPDREKVIGDLLAIKTYLTSKAIEAKRKTVREAFMECTRNIDDALAMIKEQEAVKPRVSSVEQRCGNCNKVIEMDGWKACPWCGKMIDWGRWWNKNGTHDNT